MSDAARLMMVASFDESRPAFLAALDQVVAELRPALLHVPGFYTESILGCAAAFSDPKVVRSQLEAVSPELMDDLGDDEVHDAHLLSLSYLFALTLHEMVRRHDTLPAPDPKGHPR